VLGFLIGIASGVVQFFLLLKFTTAVTGGKINGKVAIFAITQFLFPFAVLLLCAFFLNEKLMWVGIGMAAALIISAVIRFLTVSKSKKPKRR